MKNKSYIPIIGAISAGKSTFLKALLGIEVLETGIIATTKFICLIKNSSQTSFYHVIPNTQNSLTFNKEGNEIRDVEQIKKKIEEINENFSKKKGTKDDLFYMLETQIKNINNAPLLEKCIFIDIPGLNEIDMNYIEIIFSLIKKDNILFEIILLDSSSIGSDTIIRILKMLNDKECFKKEGNIFILNKIDLISKDLKKNIINDVKNYYFEDVKKGNDPWKINIIFSKNHFIPMNSLLYQAETKYNEDFYSFILAELFYYMDMDYAKYSSFLDYLEERLEIMISKNKIDIKVIKDEIDNIDEESNDMKKIKNSINKINDAKSMLITSDIILGLNLRSNCKKILKQLYVIHKKKMCSNDHPSKAYNDLNEIINNITFGDIDLVSTPQNKFGINSLIKNDFNPDYEIYYNEKELIINIECPEGVKLFAKRKRNNSSEYPYSIEITGEKKEEKKLENVKYLKTKSFGKFYALIPFTDNVLALEKGTEEEPKNGWKTFKFPLSKMVDD